MDNKEMLFEQMKNPAFVDALGQAKSLEEAVRLLNHMGIAVAPQELQRVQLGEDREGYLTEDALEFVSGGAPEVGVTQLLMPKLLQKK
ncbi:MAG: hypothetical protein E7318_03635 [Clostridiales bacterium]|nr:hypothetical protein [Clostridiales bacterium]